MGEIKERTAVDFFENQLMYDSGCNHYFICVGDLHRVFSEAKQMEKEHRDKCEFLQSALLEQRDKLLGALKEMQIDLNILQSNFRQIEKVDSRAEGMVEVIQNWIDRNHKAIENATSQNQINSNSND